MARSAGGIVRVHPREMRRRPDEPASNIHVDAVRRALHVVLGNRLHHVRESASAAVGAEHLLADLFHKVTHREDEPELRVHRVAIAGRFAVDDVGKRTVFLKASKGNENLERVVGLAGCDCTAQEDERVASPIEEPRITGYHGLHVVAPHDEEVERAGKSVGNGRGGRDALPRIYRTDTWDFIVLGEVVGRKASGGTGSEVTREPARREEVAARFLSALHLFRMSNAISPSWLLMERAAGRREHEPIFAIWLERETVLHRTHRSRCTKSLFHRALRLRGRVEAAPFEVGTENDAHWIAHVARTARDAHHIKTCTIRARDERETEIKYRYAPHAAWYAETPRGETSCRIRREGFRAILVELAAVTVVLEPSAHARPEDESIPRHGNLWISREQRVVLAAYLAPSDRHLRVRAGTVREDSLERSVSTHFRARHHALHARL